MKRKIILYGLGKWFKNFMDFVEFEEIQIIGVADKNKKIAEEVAKEIDKGVVSISPEKIVQYQFDYVIVCSETYADEMIKYLLEMQVAREKIAYWPCNGLLSEGAILKKILDSYLEKEFYNKQILSLLMKKDISNELIISDMLNLHRIRNVKDFYNKSKRDYVRVATLELLAEQIKKKNITGDIAELGVYQGDISALLNEMFPSKKLYLFDTFEGFRTEDWLFDMNNGYTNDRGG